VASQPCQNGAHLKKKESENKFLNETSLLRDIWKRANFPGILFSKCPNHNASLQKKRGAYLACITILLAALGNDAQ
jgi:hypothetical protein